MRQISHREKFKFFQPIYRNFLKKKQNRIQLVEESFVLCLDFDLGIKLIKMNRQLENLFDTSPLKRIYHTIDPKLMNKKIEEIKEVSQLISNFCVKFFKFGLRTNFDLHFIHFQL